MGFPTFFDTIAYLKNGNVKQQKAYDMLTGSHIMEQLSDFTPVLTGTIPIEIDIESSDLDIICYWRNKEEFKDTLSLFNKYDDFQMYEREVNSFPTVIARFMIFPFEVEIFGQNIPVKQQASYRHMQVEHAILRERGESFRQEVIALKREGLKTEPAFAKLLSLEGDPYEALLRYDITPR